MERSPHVMLVGPNARRFAMAQGFVMDKGIPGGSVSAPEWADGVPKPCFWTGLSMGGRERHEVATFRCPKCGYLESYAPSA